MSAAIFTSDTRPCSGAAAVRACASAVALLLTHDLLLFLLVHVGIASLILLVVPLSPAAPPRLTHSAQPGTDRHSFFVVVL
ncbi:hypothetical protein EYF80_001764 [Liparis tanakae]|uniref:Uncharacterized protein n=1 Tax=Liparis tanakae TaxID=230148 RepID=A0A4Z2JCB2_9TELE|nr:hypothetical protein EYF80_001764 [Liparis tanakae]